MTVRRPLIRCFLMASFASGCATLPGSPMQAAWYLQSPEGQVLRGAEVAKSNDIQVALLNRSSKTLTILEVVLNQTEAAGLRWSPPSCRRVLPGEMVVWRVEDFVQQGEMSADLTRDCMIPISMFVKVAPVELKDLRRSYLHLPTDRRGRVQVTLPGGMPSALPDNWICRP